MYIPMFLAGVLVTILFEFLLLTVFVSYLCAKERRNKKND